MPLSGGEIKAMIYGCDNIDNFCDKLAAAINQNLTVVIPVARVVVAANACILNPEPIPCDVIPG